ncbi:MAG TPA: molybdopterin converting factor subunit 1 [Burkholderiales bacterium]|nr:molybdopterin converting factor subunit 1 [Burkholderiales bacterium]
MRVKLVYLARLREALGTSGEEVNLPAEIRDVTLLTDWLRQRGTTWQRELSAQSKIRIAVDHKIAEDNTPIRDGSEVAFFPPVTGGRTPSSLVGEACPEPVEWGGGEGASQ